MTAPFPPPDETEQLYELSYQLVSRIPSGHYLLTHLDEFGIHDIARALVRVPEWLHDSVMVQFGDQTPEAPPPEQTEDWPNPLRERLQELDRRPLTQYINEQATMPEPSPIWQAAQWQVGAPTEPQFILAQQPPITLMRAEIRVLSETEAVQLVLDQLHEAQDYLTEITYQVVRWAHETYRREHAVHSAEQERAPTVTMDEGPIRNRADQDRRRIELHNHYAAYGVHTNQHALISGVQ